MVMVGIAGVLGVVGVVGVLGVDGGKRLSLEAGGTMRDDSSGLATLPEHAKTNARPNQQTVRMDS
jgi:hypothetical protein